MRLDVFHAQLAVFSGVLLISLVAAEPAAAQRAAPGGYADFEEFDVYEPQPRGLTRAIPAGRTVTFSSLADGGTSLGVQNGVVSAGPLGTPFKVHRRGPRAHCSPGSGRAGVRRGRDAQTFQWVDLRGDILLLSLTTHRYLKIPAAPGPVSADPRDGGPDRKDGSYFTWK